MRSGLGSYATRGVIAAMAMTGMRQLTTGLGLVPKVPPEEIFEEALPAFVEPIPVDYRDEAIELAHWAYGALGGIAFALVPGRVRRRRWAGAAYGLAAWAFFEHGLAPLLGLRRPEQRRAGERVAIAVDHVLYGLVVGGRPRAP